MTKYEFQLKGTDLAKKIVSLLISAGTLRIPDEGKQFVGMVGIQVVRKGDVLSVGLFKPSSKSS